MQGEWVLFIPKNLKVDSDLGKKIEGIKDKIKKTLSNARH